MVKVFCDRCGAPGSVAKSLWDRAQTLNNGDYMSELYIAKDDKDDRMDYDVVDLCDNCQKELEQLIITFMSAK